MKPLKFFLSNIGNRVFRDDDGCDCLSCKHIVENGLVIQDEFHDNYLFNTQNDYHAEGIELNYRLTK